MNRAMHVSSVILYVLLANQLRHLKNRAAQFSGGERARFGAV